MDDRKFCLEGQVALVTGANSPIGKAISEKLHSIGAKVILGVHKNTDRAQSLAKATGSTLLEEDLTNQFSCERLIEQTQEVYGRLDILVHNATVQSVADLTSMDIQEWDLVHAVNLRASHLLLKSAAPVLSANRENPRGAVVNVASIEAHQPSLGHGHYATSKAALIMFTRAAALEYGEKGIRVNSVSPGLIDDGELKNRWPEGVSRWLSAVPLGRLGTPEDVADAVAFLASPLANWISGADLIVDGGILTRPTW